MVQLRAQAEDRTKGAASVRNKQVVVVQTLCRHRPGSDGTQDRDGPYRLAGSFHPFLGLPSHISGKAEINDGERR